jgi:hypothetical protein
VVERIEVPENDLQAVMGRRGRHAGVEQPVWRPKQAGLKPGGTVNEPIGMGKICRSWVGVVPAGVVADLVAAVEDLPHHSLMSSYMPALLEEGSARVQAIELMQDRRRESFRPVVEGERDLPRGALAVGDDTRAAPRAAGHSGTPWPLCQSLLTTAPTSCCCGAGRVYGVGGIQPGDQKRDRDRGAGKQTFRGKSRHWTSPLEQAEA